MDWLAEGAVHAGAGIWAAARQKGAVSPSLPGSGDDVLANQGRRHLPKVEMSYSTVEQSDPIVIL